MTSSYSLTRRHFVTGLAASTASSVISSAGLAQERQHSPTNKSKQIFLSGDNFDLDIDYLPVNFTGRNRQATAINGSVPAPVLRWKEGDKITITVRNNLAVDSSIHWHGIVLPSEMDGVPGLSFGGIKPGEAFTYRFNLKQSGTYWYHSHSGFQEQTGMYGAIVIQPKEPVPYSYDREYVILLSDWSDEKPIDVYANLKKMPHMYNIDERTLEDFRQDVKNQGLGNTLDQRAMWNNMLMSSTDISDVTGKTYTFLMNGQTPADGWIGKFKRGEKILLRFINAAAMTFFDVRIPDLKMTVVGSDGNYIQPITVDEFRIGVAETYDVIVEPSTEQAYTLFCQAIDRSGFARGTLTPHESLVPMVPEMDESPVLSHLDMGMDHGVLVGSESDMNGCTQAHADMGHCEMPSSTSATSCTPEHAKMGHCLLPKGIQEFSTGKAGYGSDQTPSFDHLKLGPKIDMLAKGAQYRLADPGVGLRSNGRTVLTYADLFNLNPTPDPREPEREIELHLTGNMSRYIWSIDGLKAKGAPAIQLKFGERVRITLVNNTMMNHPMHLHGVWSDLETGDSHFIPRKHTVIVQPGSKISYLVTADARGRWAYHCHLMYHMPGMFREVRIS